MQKKKKKKDRKKEEQKSSSGKRYIIWWGIYTREELGCGEGTRMMVDDVVEIGRKEGRFICGNGMDEILYQIDHVFDFPPRCVIFYVADAVVCDWFAFGVEGSRTLTPEILPWTARRCVPCRWQHHQPIKTRIIVYGNSRGRKARRRRNDIPIQAWTLKHVHIVNRASDGSQVTLISGSTPDEVRNTRIMGAGSSQLLEPQRLGVKIWFFETTAIRIVVVSSLLETAPVLKHPP